MSGAAFVAAVAFVALPTNADEPAVASDVPELILQQRAALGLGVTADVVTQAVTDTTRRNDLGEFDGSGTPLTDTESQAFVDRQNLVDQVREAWSKSLGEHPELFNVGVEQDLWSPHVRVTVGLVDGQPGNAEAASRAIRGALGRPEVEIVVETAPMALTDLALVDANLGTSWDAWTTGQESGIFASIERVAKQPPELGMNSETGHFRIATEFALTDDVQQAVLAVADDWLRSAIGYPIPVDFEVAPPAIPAEDRNDSPGQVPGGLKISTCTNGYAVMTTQGAKLVTAGHCAGVGGALVHNNQTVGHTFVCTNNAAPILSGCTSSYGADVSLVTPVEEGYASEYGFTKPGITQINRISLTSWFTSLNTIPTSEWVCNQGASNSRLSVYGGWFQSCGWGLGTDGNGLGLAAVVTCSGDSGGLVNRDRAIVGNVSKRGGTGVGGECSDRLHATMVYRMQTAFAGWSPGPITGYNTPNSNPLPTSEAMLANWWGTCMSASGSSYSDWTPWVQWTCYPPQHDAQSLGFVPLGYPHASNEYLLVRWDGGSYRSCVSMNNASPGGGFGDGDAIHSWGCIGSASNGQVWRLEWNSVDGSPAGTGGWLRVVSKQNGKCLSVPNSDPSPGHQLIVWGCIPNHPAQRWRLDAS